MVNDSFVDILVSKWLDANRTLSAVQPQDAVFLQICDSIKSIESLLHDRGYILINNQWAYPISGLGTTQILSSENPKIKIFTDDLALEKMNGKIITKFTLAEAQRLRPELANYHATIPDANMLKWINISQNVSLCPNGVYINQNGYYSHLGLSHYRFYCYSKTYLGDDASGKIRLVTTDTESQPCGKIESKYFGFD
ncbi:MAG: hypothetical protein K6F57_03720 [Candidatus Saccharibacteria bacterium]|nr:hypothetical protein [Candidatus Saccharibacteria bacterium]